MRVLHFYKTAFPDTVGGIEQVIDQIARGANNLGVNTDVLSLSRLSNLCNIQFDGYCLYRSKQNLQIASTGFSIKVFSSFSQLAKKADVIHYHFPWPFMDMIHFVTMVKKPTVVTYHSDIIRQKYLMKIYRPLRSKFLEDVSHIVATSPNYLATSDVLTKYRQKVSVIPIGLDKATYPIPSTGKITYWRNRFGSKFFLFVGVIRYYKGLHILIEAAKGIDYPIVILGAGPIEDDLKQQASRLGLRNINFLGYLPDEDKVALLMSCYCTLFPSHLRAEAFGVSLLEGAMYGKPMISCEIGSGTTFINIENETGLVVPPSDPAALREAIRYLADHPKKAAEMGRRAEERYWQNFTADKMVRSYVDLYHNLVKHQKLD